MKKYSHSIFIFGIFISAATLWIALSKVNLHGIYIALIHSHYFYSIPLLTAYSVYYWIKAIRWQQLLKPLLHTTPSKIFSPMIIGFLGNNILPARLGEFVRMYLGAKVLKLTNTQVLATIILERLFDVLTIVFLLGIALLTSENISHDLVSAGFVATIVGLSLLFCIAIYVRWTNTFLLIINKLLFFLPSNVRNSITHQLEIGAVGLHAIRNKTLLANIIITSLAQWICMGISIYFSLQAVDITTPISASLVVLSFTVFAVVIPAAPGFFGTIQIAFLLALKPFGVSETDAVAASIFFHVITYFSVIFIGFYFLHRIGYTLRSLKAESETSDADI